VQQAQQNGFKKSSPFGEDFPEFRVLETPEEVPEEIVLFSTTDFSDFHGYGEE
jgi:hypothetical protein